MTEQTAEQPQAIPQFNVLDHISMTQFDQLAKRFGYVSRAEVDAAWSEAAQKIAAETIAQNAGSQPKTETPPADTTKRRPGRPATKSVETPQEAKPPEGDVLPPEKPVAKPAATLPKGGDPVPDLTDGAAPTVADARAALTAMVADKGMSAGMKLLADFGVKKVSDVPADKMAEFIAKAKGSK